MTPRTDRPCRRARSASAPACSGGQPHRGRPTFTSTTTSPTPPRTAASTVSGESTATVTRAPPSTTGRSRRRSSTSLASSRSSPRPAAAMPSTSRTVAQVAPGEPAARCQRASSVPLCALTCGRSRAPGSASAIVVRFASSRSASTSSAGVRRSVVVAGSAMALHRAAHPFGVAVGEGAGRVHRPPEGQDVVEPRPVRLAPVDVDGEGGGLPAAGRGQRDVVGCGEPHLHREGDAQIEPVDHLPDPVEGAADDDTRHRVLHLHEPHRAGRHEDRVRAVGVLAVAHRAGGVAADPRHQLRPGAAPEAQQPEQLVAEQLHLAPIPWRAAGDTALPLTVRGVPGQRRVNQSRRRRRTGAGLPGLGERQGLEHRLLDEIGTVARPVVAYNIPGATPPAAGTSRLSVIVGTLSDMARWREIEQETPELAARVREAFGRAKHATMATLRADGSPRISGTEVEFTDDGNVRLGSMPGAVKARDLLRDPRLAVHSPTAEPGEGGADWPGEAKVAGAAVAQPTREDGAHVFDLDLTEVVWTGLNEARDALVIRSWHPGRGVEERTRA